MAVTAGGFFFFFLVNTNVSCLFQRSDGVSGGAGLPERPQQESDREELGHSSSTWDHFPSVRPYLSHGFIL